jgi:hypothetical protein
MYRGVEVLTLVPDRAGRGGTKFGYHAFQQEPINDTRETVNVHIWQDSWRTDGAIAEYTGYFVDDENAEENAKKALALHGYSKFSLTSPTLGPKTEMLGHNVRVWGANTYGYIWNYTRVVDQVFDPPASMMDTNVICKASIEYPAVFVNVNNRCFIATGIDQAVIYDSSTGPSLYGNDGTPTAYTLGVGSPTAAPTIGALTIGTPGGAGTQASGYFHKTSKYITDNVPNGGLSTALPTADMTPPAAADTHVITADGITWDDTTAPDANTIDIKDGTSVFPTTGLQVSIANGSNIATFTGTGLPTDNGWVMLTLNVNGLVFIMEAFGNSTPPETPLIPYANQARLDHPWRGRRLPKGPLDPEDPPGGPITGWDPDDDIVLQPFTVTGYRHTMTRGGVDLYWDGIGGTTGANTVLGSILTTGGNMTWTDTAPSYAYAWYDPITGHISNISPVFTPTVTNLTNVGISVNVDVGSISYPPDTSIIYYTDEDGKHRRFTHILFFRTLSSGGSTLYPIGSLQPTTTDTAAPYTVRPNPEWMGLPNPIQNLTAFPPTTTGNFWSDKSTDADLLISGALRAPQFTNGRPRIIQNGVEQIIFPAHLAYWDGRIWVAGPQDPAALHYSCDRVQCPFGVPEESFADTNVLRIPASDGCIRGMKLIGESLLITTERWAYTIAGNNEANYRLIRVSTRMAGVGEYQMAEFVPEVEGQTALVVFIGTDGRVYAMPLGGEATPISKDIQTYLHAAKLTLRAQYAKARIHTIVTEGRRIILLFCPDVTGTSGKTFFFDFDTKTWSEHTLVTATGLSPSGERTAWTAVQDRTNYGAEAFAQPGTGANIRLFKWLNNATTGSTPAGTIRTFPLNFDGKKTRKRLHFVKLFVSDESPTTQSPLLYGWRVRLIKDYSATALTASPVQEYDSAYKQIVSPHQYIIDNEFDAELIVTDAALSPDMPILGYTFDIEVTFPNHADSIFRLYRMGVGWSTASENQVDM